jgi:type IV pilus assembly protein PilP
MRIFLKYLLSPYRLPGLALLIVFMATMMTCVHAQEADRTGLDENSSPSTEDSYFYQAEGRPDPFKSFIAPRAILPQALDPDEIVEEDRELTGMQLFEPGQLTLVGILATGGERTAMVEDQTQKGYLLKQGMLIGSRGVVTRIDPHQVIITETAYTRAGKEIKDTITMRLKKEGDR